MTEHENDPRVTDADRALVREAETGEGGIAITSVEQLLELAPAVRATKQFYQDEVASMTVDQATFVRQLRVDHEYTWRAVARACAAAWQTEWGSNQFAGIAICERAAALLGERPYRPPWN